MLNQSDLSFLRRLLGTAVVATLALSSGVSAQCPKPDQLDGGPCCTEAQPQLPRTRNFTQDALSICWTDCDVENVTQCVAEWRRGPASPVVGGLVGVSSCDARSVRLRLRDAAGAIKWTGRLKMTYSRTWLEADATGAGTQVWRFLVNGDLRPTAAAGPAPCPVPPCAEQTGNLVRFTGYVDYAKDCSDNAFEYAWMLTHACDQIDHQQGFPRGGVFHPDRSYTFVGPAAGFAVSPVLPTEGGGGSTEAVRRINLPVAGTPGGATCDYEEQLDHSLQPLQQFCLCGPFQGVPQWAVANLFLGGSCGTSITPVPGGGPFLPGFVSMGIGTWTDRTTYPGVETLRWNAGGYHYFDGCTQQGRDEVFFGVTTLEGRPAYQINSFGVGAPLPLTFIDQGNSLRQGQTVLNVPYASDHILNLNH